MAFVLKTRICYLLIFAVLLSFVLLSTASSIESCNNLEDGSNEEEEDCCSCNEVCFDGFFRSDLANNSSFLCNETDIINVTATNGTDSCRVNFTCVRCDIECAACTGPERENCTVCKDVEFNNTCMPECPEGYVPDSQGSGAGKVCIQDALNIAAIAGGAVGGLVFVIIVIIITVCLCRKRKQSSDDEGLERCTTKDDQDSEEEGFDGMNGKETLESQIHNKHEQVLRYTQDPTDNIPQRPGAVVDDRQSDLYVNQRHAGLIQKISSNETATRVLAPQVSQESQPELYENVTVKKTRSNTIELKEIEHLPFAPVPPTTGVKVRKIPEEVNSSRSPETEVSSYEAVEVTPLNSQKDIRVKAGKSASQPATGSKVPGKGPKVPNTGFKKPATKTKPTILKGPSYGKSDCDGSKLPSLIMKGPNYDSHGELNVNNDDLSRPKNTSKTKSGIMKGPNYDPSTMRTPGPKILPQTKSGLWRGPAYNPATDTYEGKGIGSIPENGTAQTSLSKDYCPMQAHSDMSEDYSEMDSPETNRPAQSEESNSDGEDYINVPNETPSGSEIKSDPIYDNVPRN